jgi:hypothetical protein
VNKITVPAVSPFVTVWKPVAFTKLLIVVPTALLPNQRDPATYARDLRSLRMVLNFAVT